MSYRYCFLGWPPQRQQWVLLCNCLVGAVPYSHYVMRSFHLRRVRVLHPAQYDLLDNHHGDRQKRKKKTVPWLSGSNIFACFTASLPTNANPNTHIMLYIVGANRGQLLYVHFMGWGGGELKTIDTIYLVKSTSAT